MAIPTDHPGAHTIAASLAPALPTASAQGAKPRGDFAILARLARDYLGHRYLAVGAAVSCMITTSSMNGALAYLADPFSKKIFLDKDASMVAILSIAIVVVVAVR